MKIIKVSNCNSPNNFISNSKFINCESSFKKDQIKKFSKNILNHKVNLRDKLLCKNHDIKPTFKTVKNEKIVKELLCFECGVKQCMKGSKVKIIETKLKSNSNTKNFKNYCSPKNKNNKQKFEFSKINKRETHKIKKFNYNQLDKNKIEEIIQYRIITNNFLSDLNNKKFKIKMDTNKSISKIEDNFKSIIDKLINMKENLISKIYTNNNNLLKKFNSNIKLIKKQLNLSDWILDYSNKYSLKKNEYSYFLNKIKKIEELEIKDFNFFDFNFEESKNKINNNIDDFIFNNIIKFLDKKLLNFNNNELKLKLEQLISNKEKKSNKTHDKNILSYASNNLNNEELTKNLENFEDSKIKKNFSDFSSNLNLKEEDKSIVNILENKKDNILNKNEMIGYFTKKIKDSNKNLLTYKKKENKSWRDDLGCDEKIPSISELLNDNIL